MIRALGLLSVLLLVIAQAAAWGDTGHTLLLEAELTEPVLVLELDRAEVKIVLDAEAAGRVRVSAPAAAGLGPGAVTGRREGRRATLTRVDEGGAIVTVAVTAPPATRFEISGTELAVTLEADPGTSASGASAAGAAPAVSIRGERSRIGLRGVAGARISGRELELRLEEGQGRAVLSLTDGTAEVTGHRGEVELQVTGGRATVDGCQGPLAVRSQGGELLLAGGRGSADLHLEDALLRVDGWEGKVSVNATGSVLDLRGGSAGSAELDLRGTATDAVVDGWPGAVRAAFHGGTLAGRGWGGPSQVDARELATAELAELHGNLELRLARDASARVAEVAGQLTAVVQEGRLDVDGAGGLQLTAVDSEVTVRRVERLGRLGVRGSVLDLDLSELQLRRPALRIEGGTRATIHLPSPCLVEVAGPFATGVSVSGCELLVRGQGRRQYAPRSTEGERMMRLSLQLAEDATVEVEGL
jgi:hypothetical protein